MMPAAYGTAYAAPKAPAAPAPAATTTAPAAPMAPGKTRKVPPKRALEPITFNDTDSQPAAQRRRFELDMRLRAWSESENMPFVSI